MLKHTAVSLAMAFASATSFAHALESRATDADAPALLPVSSDISLAELERR